MQKQTEQILKEIYKIDPGLKQHQDSLVRIIEGLVSAKLEVKVDRDFVKRLKGQLEQRVSQKQELPSLGSVFPLSKYLSYAMASIVIVALAAVSIAYFTGQEQEQPPTEKTGITEMEEKAFGEIAFTWGESADDQNRLSAEQAAGIGGELLTVSESSEADSKAEIYPYPYRINYEYVYEGGSFSPGKDSMPVYKKTDNGQIGNSLSSILGSFNLNAINLQKFKNAQVGSLQIAEDREYGYILYIDSQNDYLSISMNWKKWPQDVYSGQLKESDRLSDQKILEIAGNFVKSYGIDTSLYGSPEIRPSPVLYAMLDSGQREESGTSYIAESRSVVYPLLLQGEKVYDQSGRKVGMTLEVSLRYKKVTYAGSIFVGGFESSKYDIETDREKIISSAEKGGMDPYYSYDDQTETVQIKLGTPSLQLVRIWQRAENKYFGEELYIPAYVFPITEEPEKGHFHRQSVIVPLTGIQQEDQIRPMLEETE